MDTIRIKAEFTNKICDEIKTWNNLTEEVPNMTEKIAKFIIENIK